MKIIAALDRNGVIGVDGKIPWHSPEDMRNFRSLTIGCPVIMGAKTFMSMGGPLKDRYNIIISKTFGRQSWPWSAVYNDYRDVPICGDSWVIGGAEIYRLFAKSCTDLYLTVINSNVNYKGDITYFPLDAFGGNWSKQDEKKLGTNDFYHFRRLESSGNSKSEGEPWHENQEITALLNQNH